MLTVAPHCWVDVRTFVTAFPHPLGEVATPPEVLALFSPTATAPMQSSDVIRNAVRNLLRHGGFKPTGRSKPSAEYLLKAVAEGILSSINCAVDVGNAVSLHSGLPISVVDLDKAQPPFSIDVAPDGANYVFNATGQVIDLSGLVCLHDAAGPCANAVKDAQRTKTDANTRRTLSVIWGTTALPNYVAEVETWYRNLLTEAGARTKDFGSAR